MPEIDEMIIVAIEFGSSVSHAVACKKSNGKMEIIAHADEPSSGFIRRGTVYNIDNTTKCINSLVQKISEKISMKVDKVFVCVGGQSLHSEKKRNSKKFSAPTKISDEIVVSLERDEVFTPENSNYEVLDCIPLEYKIDNDLQQSAVGFVGSEIEGNYLSLIYNSTFHKNLTTAFDNSTIETADSRRSANIVGQHVLTDVERNTGCVLVDLGAQTTTVVIYKRNNIRRIMVIPIGANSITKDICSKKIEEYEAEEKKCKYGSAIVDATNSNANDINRIKLSNNNSLSLSEFNKIIAARVEEIAKNVNYQIIESGYANELRAGAILMGGGAKLANIDAAFKKHLNIDSVRIAKFVNDDITCCEELKDGTYCNVVSLAIEGDLDCCSPAKIEEPKPEPKVEFKPEIKPEAKPEVFEPVKTEEDRTVTKGSLKPSEDEVQRREEETLRKAKEHEAEWNALRNKQNLTINEVKEFLADNPGTPFKKEAENKIKELTPKKPSKFSSLFNKLKNKWDDATEEYVNND